GLALFLVADHVDGGSVFQSYALPEIAVGTHLGRQFAVRINHKWQLELVFGGKFLGETPKIVLGNFQLMGEALVAEFVPQFLRFRIEIARHHRGIERPRMKWQRKIVLHYRYVVGAGSLFQQRRRAGAVGTLEILKDNNSDLGAFGRLQRGKYGVVLRLPDSKRDGDRQGYNQQQELFHIR